MNVSSIARTPTDNARPLVSDSISLQSLVNVSSLENVMRTVLTQLKDQQLMIGRLDKRLSTKSSQSQVLQQQHNLAQMIEATEKKITLLQAKFDLLTPKLDQITSNSQEIEKHNDVISSKVNAEDFELNMSNMKANFSDIALELSQSKADSLVVSKLEESQRCMSECISSLEGSVACKLDKVELPFLQASSKKLQDLVNFRDEFGGKVNELIVRMEELSETVTSKEDTKSVSARFKILNKKLNWKIDSDFFDEKLKSFENFNSEKIDRFLDEFDFERLTASLADLKIGISSLRNDVEGIKNQHQQISEEVSVKASELSLNQKVNRQEFDESLQNCFTLQNLQQEENHKSKEEILADMNALKEDRILVHSKLKLVMRFIDWFSDFKLLASNAGSSASVPVAVDGHKAGIPFCRVERPER